MNFYYFRLRVAAVLRPICLGLSIIACCMMFIPGAIGALDSLFRVPSLSVAEQATFEETVVAWREVLEFGEISRHHRLANKKTALWWKLIEHNDITQLKKALKKKERKEIKRWLSKNKRNLDMQLAYHVWLHKFDDSAIAIKRVKNLAQKFPEYEAFAEHYNLWTKKDVAASEPLDKTSLEFLEAR